MAARQYEPFHSDEPQSSRGGKLPPLADLGGKKSGASKLPPIRDSTAGKWGDHQSNKLPPLGDTRTGWGASSNAQSTQQAETEPYSHGKDNL